MSTQNNIKIKTPEEIVILREGAKILSGIIKRISCSLESGMTTAQVNDIAEKLTAPYPVQPAFKGYRGYPASICVSVNQEVVHGIPGKRVIKDGDIVSLDMGLIFKKYYTDMAVTVAIGEVNAQQQQLLQVAQDALMRGIAQAKADNHLSDISSAVQSYVEKHGFSVVRDFVGHGIGKNLHEEPEIPNFGPPHCGPVLKEGMVFCIEPMINVGSWQTRIKEDGWTVETVDGKPSAHFEHMVVIKKSGPEILTRH